MKDSDLGSRAYVGTKVEDLQVKDSHRVSREWL